MWDDLASVDPRFAYKGERTRYIAFPLGGVGSGGFSISGSGRLVDWSIRNRPALQGYNGYSHFAIKAEKDGKLVDARVLNGPYDLNPSGAPGLRKMFDGFGHGANRQTLVGVPHFREVDFYGRFPTADLVFKDERFPGGVRLTALSPFIPHNDHDSAMPVAMFEFELVNDTGDDLTYTLAGTLGNYGANSGIHTFERKNGRKHAAADLVRPEFAAGRSWRPDHRHRRRGRRPHRLSLPRPVVRQPRCVLEGIRTTRPAAGAALRQAAAVAAYEPAARAWHAGGARDDPGRRAQEGALRHLLELSDRRHLLGVPRLAGFADPRPRDADLAQLLRQSLGGLRGKRTRRPRALGQARR